MCCLKISAVIFAVCFATPLREYELISAVGPEDDELPQLGQLLTLDPESLGYFIVAALEHAAVLYQMLLNYRAKTFAGQYRWGAWMALCVSITEWLYFVPCFVGVVELRRPVSVSTVIASSCVFGMALQAVLYPSPDQEIAGKSGDK